jgi:hypothetical protein
MIKKILITTTLALGMLFISNIVGINYFSDSVSAVPGTTTAPTTSVPPTTGSSSGSGATTACENLKRIDPGATCDTDIRTKVSSVRDNVISTIIYIIGVLCVIMIVVGGLMFVLSSGDPGKVKSARDMIIYSAIGLAVAIFAQAIVSFVLSRF